MTRAPRAAPGAVRRGAAPPAAPARPAPGQHNPAAALPGQAARYLLVGLAVVAFDYALFLALFPRHLLPAAALNLLTLSSAAALGLLLHRRYTFRSTRRLSVTLVLLYASIATLNYALSTAVLLGALALGWPAWLAKGAAVAVGAAASFALSRRLLAPRPD